MANIRQKVLITGGGGLLGHYLNNFVSVDYDILTLYRSRIGNCVNFNSMQVDITNFKLLSKCISEYKPDYIIHCAAVSNPSKADELGESEVYDANCSATEHIVRSAESIRAKIIYTSTDLVYDGNLGSYLDESAKLKPLTLYARTKFLGEVILQTGCRNFLIARVPLLFGYEYGVSKNNFTEMIENFQNGRRVRLFYDQFRTPLSVRETARIITCLLKTRFNNDIINLSSKRRVSRVEIGEMVCTYGNFNRYLIDSVSMNSVAGLVGVADVSLNINKLLRLGIEPASIEEMVEKEAAYMKTNFRN